MGLEERRLPTKSTGPQGSAEADPVCLHEWVSESLRTRVVNGDLAVGLKLPALSRLAKEFDVSTMTVRRAFHTLERQGYVERKPGVGVFVRPYPPGRKVDANTIVFVGTDLESPFQMAIARGAQQACQARGGAIRILDGHFHAESEICQVSRLPACGASGAIVLPPFRDPKTIQALRELHSGGFPMVVVDMVVPGLYADFVTSDHEAAAHTATTHLLQRGHSTVLFATLPLYASSVVSRVQGYERALQESGKRPSPEWKIWIDLDEHIAGYEQNRKWWGSYKAVLPCLKVHKPPLAILAIDAYVGWGIYEACRELGLRIPEDVSVVAFDEIEIVHALRPPMTVVAQRLDEIGRSAVELLERRIQTGPAEDRLHKTLTQVIIGVDLIERGSVANLTDSSAAS